MGSYWRETVCPASSKHFQPDLPDYTVLCPDDDDDDHDDHDDDHDDHAKDISKTTPASIFPHDPSTNLPAYERFDR